MKTKRTYVAQNVRQEPFPPQHGVEDVIINMPDGTRHQFCLAMTPPRAYVFNGHMSGNKPHTSSWYHHSITYNEARALLKGRRFIGTDGQPFLTPWQRAKTGTRLAIKKST